MKRWAFGIVVVLLGVLGGWWWLHEDEAAAVDDATASANEGAVPVGALKSRWNDPIVQRGSRRVTGVVLRDGQPVSGATVTALAAHGDDVLSDLPCQCDNHCGQKLLACGCAEASGQLVELLGARTGEGAPLGRATSASDGTFAIEGLDESKLTLWADAPGAIGWVTDIASDASDVKLTVSPGKTIKGKVTTTKEAPASGALVTAIFAQQSRFFETTTRADGTFEIGPIPKGKYAVVAMQDGLLPDHSQADDDDRALVMELSVPRALSGTVTLDGKPVAAAKVKLDGMHRKRTVFTDAQGVFHIERLRPGEYELNAEGSGALGATKTLVNKREDRDGVVIELVRGVPLDGVVVDDQGAPVAGAKVDAAASGKHWVRVESDAKGRFHFDTVAEGPRSIIARKDGFLSRDVEEVTGGGAPVTLTLLHASVLSGRVQTVDGTVVTDFRISASRPDAGSARFDDDDIDTRRPGDSASARSTDGGFSLDLAPGDFEVFVSSEQFIDERVTLRAPASEAVITVKAGGVIRGTVLDNDGAPVAHAMVVGTTEKAMKNVRTDDAGHFALEGLVTGKWKVLARPDFTSNGLWSASTTVEVTVGRESSVELREPAGAKLAGVVLDAAGNPVAQARVSASTEDSLTGEGPEPTPVYERASTDDTGHFRLRTMPAGKVQLTVEHKESGRKTLTVTAPDENIIIKLEEGTFVAGRVVDDAGRVVKEFSLEGRPFDTEDGRFKTRSTPGKQHFAIDAVGFAQHMFDVDVKEGKNELGDIKLSRGLKLTGLVFDAKTKEPIAGALVDVSTTKPEGGVYLSERFGAVRTDAKGRYTITIDPASTWAVATHEAHVMGVAQIPFGGQTLDLPMGSGAQVTVSVVDAQGSPVTDARVWGTRETAKEFSPSSPPGTFVGKAFEPGEWVFRAATRDNRLTFERLTVTLTDSPQTLVLREQTGGVDITVTTPKPVRLMLLVAGRVSVQDLRSNMMTREVISVANGVAKHVQPGTWTLVAIDGARVALQPLEVTASGPTKVDLTASWEPLPR